MADDAAPGLVGTQAGDAAPGLVGFGGFTLGGMSLALPMAALREVLPCAGLTPLPCPAPSVPGGVDLRGTTVAALDLRVLLGQPPQPLPAGACVVIIAHQGRLLGLLADGVTGVFQAAAGSLARAEASDPLAAILAGSVRREDNGQVLTLLSPQALAALPQVPWVHDPAAEAEADGMAAPAQADAAVDDGATQVTTMVLLRCGPLPLALDAMQVHATVPGVQLRPSPLAQGHCRGVMSHLGRDVPAVDPLALCGLGRLDLANPLQAVLLPAGGGLVALLVDQVIDVVRVDPRAVLPVPALALPQPELVAGALPTSALAPELVERLGDSARQFLVLQAQALQTHEHLAGLGSTCRGGADGGANSGPNTGLPAAQGAALAGQRRFITFELGAETATPIEQIVEILPYEQQAEALAGEGALLGLQLHRGRAIPVMCLSQLQGRTRPPVTSAASVLVVECDGSPLGFAVPQLRSIEMADWPGGADSSVPATGTRGLARLGSGVQQRMMRVLDLQRLAGELQAGNALSAH